MTEGRPSTPTGDRQVSKGHTVWRASFDPSRQSTDRQNTLALAVVLDGHGPEGKSVERADTDTAFAAITAQLSRDPLPIEFPAWGPAPGQQARLVGRLTKFELRKGADPSAVVIWEADVANNLRAWHIHGKRPALVFTIGGGHVKLTLAPPDEPIR
jgi:hypothetical protein